MTPAAIAGDWLTTVFDQNPQRITTGGDVSAIIEQEAIDQMLQLFHLPPVFKGGFVTGATMSNFTGLAVGRQWAGTQRGNDIALEGIQTSIKVLAGYPHSSSIKCLSMPGIGSKNIEFLKTAEGYNFYWHVDAAFGGFAACSPAYRHLLHGWEDADSITIDLHKWMNLPYDSAIYLINSKHAALQVQTFQNGNAPYLGDPEKDFSYLNFGPENSRRLRALPALLSMMAYGRKGFEWIVENAVIFAPLPLKADAHK